MGSNRKHQRGQPPRRFSNPVGPSGGVHGKWMVSSEVDEDLDVNNDTNDSNISTMDLQKVLQEVEGSFHVTWKEILLVFVGVFLLALLSICVGVAAGMTISIHYYENQSPFVRSRFDVTARDYELFSASAATTATGLYGGNAAYQRVTTLDPMIVSSNVMKSKNSDYASNLDLGKVITTTASGQLNVLMVVEETAPLLDFSDNEDMRDGGDNIYGSSGTMNGSSASHGENGYDEPPCYSPSSSYSNANEDTTQHSCNNANSNKHLHGQRRNDNLQSDPNKREYDYRGSREYRLNSPPRAHVDVRQSRILPVLCSDGETYGFDKWQTLKAAVQEANAISAERFMKWNEFFAAHSEGIDSPYTFASWLDDALYYEEDVIFTICPGATLKARRGPIFLNAENVLIECEGCVIDVGGTHLAFGPHARNILVRGLTFKSARTSSLTFFHDGADASFEDCFWIGNAGINGKFGAVADVNSTSTVNFYRCEISQGRKGYGTMAPGFASSLSIRS